MTQFGPSAAAKASQVVEAKISLLRNRYSVLSMLSQLICLLSGRVTCHVHRRAKGSRELLHPVASTLAVDAETGESGS